MIAVLEQDCPLKQKADIVRFVEAAGFRVQVSEHEDQSLVGVIGPGAEGLAEALRAMPGVREIRPVAPPYPLVSREQHPDSSRVKIDDITVGGNDVIVMAGPCAVESREQIFQVADAVAAAGASMLRGGAFKPRSSPYSFQGLGQEGLELLAEARERTGLRVVTESWHWRTSRWWRDLPTSCRSVPGTCRTSGCCRLSENNKRRYCSSEA